MLVFAILGPVAVRAKGDMRIGCAYLNLFGLGWLVVIYLLNAPRLWPWKNSAFVLAVVSVVAGLVVIALLLSIPRLPEWLTSFLPVRGNHARRLLATLTIALLLEPLLYFAGLAVLGHRLDTDGFISGPVAVVAMILVALMTLPLWDVLARGWHLDGRDG
jgi:hypothetical protein